MAPSGNKDPDSEQSSASKERPKKDAARSRSGGKARRDRPAADEAPRSKEERLERVGVLAALEAGIAEALPGIEILDRDLVLDEAGRADLVAVDPIGRLVLVSVANEDTDRAVLETLDLLAFARANAALLVRHIASRRVDPGLEPRVVVIDPASDPRLADRLAALRASGIEVFGVKTMTSQAGERSYLVAAGVAGAPTVGPGGVEAFLDALPIPLREVGRELAERMARLDDDLTASADQSALVWRFNGSVLARLAFTGDRLTASVAPLHEPATIRANADLDLVLESALGRLLAEFEGDEPDAGGDAGRGEPNRLERAIEGPILSDEELSAFMD